MEDQEESAKKIPIGCLKGTKKKQQQQEKTQKRSVEFDLDSNVTFVFTRNQEEKTEKIAIALSENTEWIENKPTAFSEEEMIYLKEKLCKYAIDNSLGQDGLLALVSSDKTAFEEEHIKSAWKEISEGLSNRSVESCIEIARNRFNPNHESPWTESQKKQLPELVSEKGKKWKIIAEQLSKSVQQVKDLYRQQSKSNQKDFDSIITETSNDLGFDFVESTQQQLWSVDELFLLIKSVGKEASIKLLKKKKTLKERVSKFERKDWTEDSNLATLLSDQGFSNFIQFSGFEEIKDKLESLNWETISESLPSRSAKACKKVFKKDITKYISELEEQQLHETQNASQDLSDSTLIQMIVDQDADSESEIDFSAIENGKNQNENLIQWQILKKRVNNQTNPKLKYILAQLMRLYPIDQEPSHHSHALPHISSTDSELFAHFKLLQSKVVN